MHRRHLIIAVLLGAAAPAEASPYAYVLTRQTGTSPGSAQLDVIDAGGPAASHLRVRSIGVAPEHQFLEVDADHHKVYLNGESAGFVQSLDTGDTSLVDIPGGGVNHGGFAPLADARRIALVDPSGLAVVLLDRVTFARTTIPVGTINDTPRAIVATPDGFGLYVATSAGTLQYIHLIALTVSPRATNLGNSLDPQLAIAPDGSAVYAAYGGQVTRVVIATGQKTTASVVTVGTAAVRELAITSDGATIYAAQLDGVGNQHRLLRIDTATLAASAVSVGGPPVSVAVNPANTLAYVVLPVTSVVQIFDLATFTFVRNLSTNVGPVRVRFVDLPTSTRLWSPAFANDTTALARPEYATLAFVDLDQDGADDLCGRVVTGTMQGLYCALNEGQRFGPLRWVSAEFGASFSANESYWWTIRYADVDGDGSLDVCGRRFDGYVCARYDRQLRKFGAAQVWLVDVADFVTASTVWNFAEHYKTLELVDVTGDGRADLCGRDADGLRCATSSNGRFNGWQPWTSAFSNAAGWALPQYYTTIRFGDITGDGLPDVCGRGANGVLCGANRPLAFSGRFFDVSTTVPWAASYSDANGWNQPAYYATLQLADTNGDGRLDLCGRGGGGMYCDVSNGSRFLRRVLSYGFSPDFSDALGWNVERFYRTLRVTDVDGDGLADICARGNEGIYCARAKRSNQDVTFRPAELRIRYFGDDQGWGVAEGLWSTVKPARVDLGAGAEVCGRGADGIRCSNL